jgi:prophage regulatory protein
MNNDYPANLPSHNNRVVRLPEVIGLTGLSRSSIYAAVSRGTFPPPVRLGVRAVGWQQQAVLDWLAERPATRPAGVSATPLAKS